MITLICGPMYSGKSTLLLQRMERSLYANRKILLIRPAKDDRGYLTHNDKFDPVIKLKDKFPQLITWYFTNEIDSNILHAAESKDEVFIDEYFMIKDCKEILKVYGKNVKNIYFAGLLASSENKLFDETIDILPYCDSIKKMNGVCTNCGSENGNFSKYIGNDAKTNDILVGDSVYECRCFNCL